MLSKHQTTKMLGKLLCAEADLHHNCLHRVETNFLLKRLIILSDLLPKSVKAHKMFELFDTSSAELFVAIAWLECQNMSRIRRKSAFCISKNKGADQLHLGFLYTDSTIPLLPKSENSSL